MPRNVRRQCQGVMAIFIRFRAKGKYKPRTLGPVIFASLRSNVISVLSSKDVWLEWGKLRWLERKV